MADIKFEPGTYRLSGMEFRLLNAPNGSPKVQIEHRVCGSKWWDIAHGSLSHSQAAWDAIKSDGTKIA